jgi:alpha-L-arabinofuranosidase
MYGFMFLAIFGSTIFKIKIYNMTKLKVLLSLIAGLLLFPIYAQQTFKIDIQANKPYAQVQPTMWGVFFEDINFAADGGIYAELVKNRSFEFYRPLMAWKEGRTGNGNGRILVINRGEENANNPRFGRITFTADSGAYTLTNEGFRGMGVFGAKQYNFSILARVGKGENISFTVQLIKGKDEVVGESSPVSVNGDWKKYEVSLKSTSTEAKSQLRVLFTGNGILDIDMVSLFPEDTWKHRKNGLRADLVQLLADMKPGFVRFPGGCIVEGFDLSNRYEWKNTIGNVEDRKLIINRWNTEFRNRQFPDYFQSYGLGFYEYFLLSEDIGAEPLPILNCGMACQYNSGEVVPMNQLDPYIQDALDLIEFANGTIDSKWGKKRAEMGHPAPFNLKMLGVGNEQWDEQYVERYIEFSKAIKAKYPEMKLISSAGPSPDGPRFKYLWDELRKLNADFIDEHYYQNPAWFLKNANRYDNYDRKGPKVFAGEYASHSKEDKASESRNNWESALTEAAFMTGLERNVDVVQMSSYAPLLAHVEAWQWRPDMIWFDNLNSIGTPNYYVQKVFSTNRGTDVVPALYKGEALGGNDSLYISTVIDKKRSELIIKIVNVSKMPVEIVPSITGATPDLKKVSVDAIGSDDLMKYNSIENPDIIKPTQSILSMSKSNFKIKVNGQSVYIVKIPCSKL